jgi:tetraacyldisaccharide 4'-kinase
MKTPKFWYREPNPLLQAALQPIAALYQCAQLMRKVITIAHDSRLPIICVGNVVSGGAGKTPVVMALAKHLQQQGIRPHILSRGYGGDLWGPVLLDKRHHTFSEVGDEPLLLADIAPTWIAKNRVEGVHAIESFNQADVILLDDGLQNPSIKKDYSILVIDGNQGLGNGALFPAGPLRESFVSAIKKSHCVIAIDDTEGKIRELTPPHIEFVRARIVPSPESHSFVTQGNRKLLPFAGIGYPEKFFNTLRRIGGTIVETVSFPDHHTYSHEELKELIRKAKMHDAQLITTTKDYVRLPIALRQQVYTLNIFLDFDDSFPDFSGVLHENK